MTTVWVLEVDAGYGDGRAVLGVFSTKEAAMAISGEQWRETGHSTMTVTGSYEVTAFVLDSID